MDDPVPYSNKIAKSRKTRNKNPTYGNVRVRLAGWLASTYMYILILSGLSSLELARMLITAYSLKLANWSRISNTIDTCMQPSTRRILHVACIIDYIYVCQ